jgi:hypothetical protein
MGYPGLKENNAHIESNCTGQFLRHHTVDKAMTKASSGNALLQSMTELMQTALLTNKQDFWASDSIVKTFMENFDD